MGTTHRDRLLQNLALVVAGLVAVLGICLGIIMESLEVGLGVSLLGGGIAFQWVGWSAGVAAIKDLDEDGSG